MTKAIACFVCFLSLHPLSLCFTPLYCSILLEFNFYFMYPWPPLPIVKELEYPMKVFLEFLTAQNSATFPRLKCRISEQHH